jgi:uridylate kinase
MFDMFNEENASAMEENYAATSSSSSSGASYSSSYNANSKGFVISVGGSVFIGEKPFVDKISEFCSVVNDLSGEFNLVLVVGGGRTCRVYQEVAKDLGANNFELDKIGIASTKLNTLLFTYKIDKASSVLDGVSEAKKVIEMGKIPVFGGINEGQTTDAVGALIAESLGYDFVNLSNVDGIYDCDPNENEDAVLFKELSFSDMNFLVREKLLVPGQHLFVDPQAASILSRSKIISYFLNGDHLENFKNALRSYDYKGTIVHDVEDLIEKDSPLGEEARAEKVIDELDEIPIRKTRKRVTKTKEIDPREIDFGK